MPKHLNAPSKEEIKKAREAAGLTQVQAAELVGVIERAWQRYEAGDRAMSAAMYELFLIKTGQA